MKNMIKNHLILLSLLLSIVATYHGEVYAKAKSRSKQHITQWNAEPDSFLGIKFGQSLDSQLTECPKEKDRFGYSEYISSTVTCWKKEPFKITIAKPPELGFLLFYDLTVELVNGLVEDATIEFNHTNYKEMLALFVERYGNPTAITKESFQTFSGGKLEGYTLTWLGKNITIIFREYRNKIDKSSVSISTEAYFNNLKEEKRNNVIRYKDRL